MSKQKLLELLQKKDQSVEKAPEQNPYSQNDLSDHISDSGFAVEGTPDISGMAESLKSSFLDTKEGLDKESTRNHLTMLHKHLAASGKIPKVPGEEKPEIKQEHTPVNKQLNMKAMHNLIAKYRGKK
jgi:hypothetical protein